MGMAASFVARVKQRRVTKGKRRASAHTAALPSRPMQATRPRRLDDSRLRWVERCRRGPCAAAIWLIG